MKYVITIIGLGLTLVGLNSCSRQTPSTEPPIHLVQNMDEQPKYKAQAASRFFADGSSMRLPVEGTVARGTLRLDSSIFYTGRDSDGNLVVQITHAKTDQQKSRSP